MKTYTTTILSLLVFFNVLISNAQDQKIETIHFPFDSHTLDKNAVIKTNKIGNLTQGNHRSFKILLSGHTDNYGEDSYNDALSQKRVQAVRKQLINNGIDSVDIKLSHYGEKKPATSNNHDSGRQKNRRVEILVEWEKAKIITAFDEDNDIIYSKNKAWHNPDTTFICSQGAQIIIDKEAFYPYPISEISFDTREYYDLCDMINDNITTTTSSGDCLTSGGMLFVNATFGNESLQPNEGYKIKYRIPAVKNKPDKEMKLYIEKSNKNGELEWEELNAELTVGDGDNYFYEFEMDTIAGINIDKPIKVKCYENPPLVKIKGFQNSELFLTYPEENYLSKGHLISNRKFSIAETADDKNPLLTVHSTKNSLNYMASKSLTELKFRNSKNMYIVKKKYFRYVKVRNPQDGIDDQLCNYLQASS